jgi:DNA-binding CsgD family transcriptional regulator
VVWVEGEAGIGKSSLVAEALASANQPGWDIGWGGADQLISRLPLRVMQECLQARPRSTDPRRAHAASLLSGARLGPVADNASVKGIEVLLTLADELCAAAPTVLVLDDLQWADDASLAVWDELASSISQMRLLLIATCRLAPLRPEVKYARAAVMRRGGQFLGLKPLAEPDVTALVTSMVGGTPGERLLRLTAQADGNPFYLRELVDGLLREQAVEIRAVADVAPQHEKLPVSLAGVLDGRIGSVSEGTTQLLRVAALLGSRFSVADMSIVMRRPAMELAPGLQEAVAAGIVEEADAELAFRHPLIRQSLYESTPEALRMALHAEAAKELAAAGTDALSVAKQLSGAGRQGDGTWARSWLVQATPELVTRAPQLAVDLLRPELRPDLKRAQGGDDAWDTLTVGLVRALLSVGNFGEAVSRASQALAMPADTARQGERCWALSHALVYTGHGQEIAIREIRSVLAQAGLPRLWQARLLAVLAMIERLPSGIEVSRTAAREALTAAEEVGDPSASAQALYALWLANSIGRDHVGALDSIDRALRVMGDDPLHDDLRSSSLDSRTFTLQNLDEWHQAELALRQSREFARQSGRPDRGTLFSAAVLGYWLGKWDDAIAELGPGDADEPTLANSFLRERWAALLLHGVGALIAGRRDQRAAAARHLKDGLALPIESVTDRENQDFLVAAHALSLEQAGETRQAMERLAGLVPRSDNEMTLAHQWMPDLVRLALAAGDTGQAHAAARICQEEAEAETKPARAYAASLRCSGLLEADPDRLADAVAHYRSTGPAVDLPAAMEDLAVVLAGHGRVEEARNALNEAIGLYEGIGARWDIKRADGRLRPLGIRRRAQARRRQPPAFGWEALTPTEVRVAAFVARGDSTPDIAREMFLSRRTVQTYISHILTKLNARSRVDIAREALNRGITP